MPFAHPPTATPLLHPQPRPRVYNPARQLQIDTLSLSKHLERGRALPPPATGLGAAWSHIPNRLFNHTSRSGAGASIGNGLFDFSNTDSDTLLLASPPSGFNPSHRRGSTSTTTSSCGSTRVVTPVMDEIYSIPTPLFHAPMIPCSDCDQCSDGDIQDFKDKDALLQVPTPVVAQYSQTTKLITAFKPSTSEVVSSSANDAHNYPSPISSSTASPDSEYPPRDSVLAWNTRSMVNEGVEILLWRGTEALVKVLLDLGIQDYQSATPTATVAHTILKELSIRGIHKFKEVRVALRFGALGIFREHWRLNGDWQQLPASSEDTSSRGVNTAGFIGALYTAGIATADDVHLCLDFLVNHEPDFTRLCAMHALITHANDKLCKAKFVAGTTAFRDKLSIRDQTGMLIWGKTNQHQFLIADIMNTIERWFAMQSLKRARSGAAASVNCRLNAIAAGASLGGGSLLERLRLADETTFVSAPAASTSTSNSIQSFIPQQSSSLVLNSNAKPPRLSGSQKYTTGVLVM